MSDNQIAGKIAEYFDVNPDDRDFVTIDQVFTPGEGWHSSRNYSLRATLAMLRGLANAGSTDVAVAYQGRIADFTIAEVIKYAERPLFGGRLI